jgi:hypothetical protein
VDPVKAVVPGLVQPVSANHPMYEAFVLGKIPQHSVCGHSPCDWEALPTESGWNYFGVFCPRCRRSLMLGEVNFVNPR